MLSPQRLVPGLLAAAALLALAMALTEGINQRPDLWRGPPDEYGHRAAARFYVDHWLPPKVGDPASLDSYSRDYGLSYLNDPDPVYFLAGKFAALASPVVDPHRAFRLFNVSLLAILALVAWRRPGVWPLFLPLLVTPQAWYVFSYFNNDAFPLFLSFLVGLQLIDRESLFNRYLDARGLRQLHGLALMVLLLGLLVVSKRNYFVFLALVGAALALHRLGLESAVLVMGGGALGAAILQGWFPMPALTAGWLVAVGTTAVFAVMLVRPGTRAQRLHVLGRLALAGSLAIALVMPRYFWDSLQHGSLDEKVQAQTALQQRIAKPEYKPQTINTALESAYHGIEMRNRGMPLSALFKEPWNWHIRTFVTSTGSYGWLEFQAGTIYRVLLLLGYVAVFAAYARAALRAREPVAIVGFVQVSVFIALTVGITLFHSWNNDFQAQGRYLFPILPILGLGLLQLRDHLPVRAVLGATAFCFVLSAYSFTFAGLAQVPRTFPP